MIAIISVTEKGDWIGEKIKGIFGGDLYFKTKMEDFKLKKVSEEVFNKYKVIVFISSTGIAVRGIDGLVNKKSKDPAVIVVDVCNKFTISLLSGHLGGANLWTKKIAEVLENIPVITTGTDGMDKEAPDMVALENNLEIESFEMAKRIASLLVNDKKVYFKDDKHKIALPKGYIETDSLRKDTLWVTHSNKEFKDGLKLIRKDIVLGIGCRRDTEFEKLKKFILDALEEIDISPLAVKKIGTIELKKDEVGLLEIGDYLGAEMVFFKAEEIKKVHCNYSGSDFVERITGVRCVSEPSLELLKGKVIRPLEKKDGITLTIGVID